MVDDHQMSSVLSDFAYTLTSDAPTSSILEHLVQQIVGVLPVTSAGVTLITPGGQPRYVAASDTDAMRFEELQSDLAEGPCLLAHESGSPVSVPRLDDETRFPRFAPAALGAGMAAVFTFPMRHGHRRLGALDLYRDSPGELEPLDFAAAQTLANVATAYLLNARAREEASSDNDEMRHLVTHDALTGLPNRTLLVQRIEHVGQRARRSHAAAGVLFADLDRFKLVNDTHGHQVGDELLRAVAERLTHLVRPGDTLARVYGDEFVLLCEDVRDRADVAALAERVRRAFADPFVIGDLELAVTASVGVAFAGPGEEISERMVSDADQAMYDAKRKRVPREAHLRRLEATPGPPGTVDDLASAIERHEMQLGFQPVVSCAHGAVTGVEVQLRWTPDGSAPAASGAVAGVAERSGLIRELDSWLLEHGCREAVRWAQEHPRLRLDVNVSMHQLRSLAFVEEVGQTLQRTGLAPGDLVVGVSESTLVEAGELAPTVLHGLRDLGVKVALDDFGTGFASLDRLRRMPLDLLKLDLSLVDRDDRSEAIVAPLVALAHVLDLTVLVEGISTTRQRHVATAAGADQAQGSYFAPPMSSTAVDLLLDGAVDPEGRLLLPVAG